MRWRRRAGGGDVEDRRSRPGGRAALPLGGGVIGVVALVLVLLLGGGDYNVSSPFERFPSQERPAGGSGAMRSAPDAESELVDFVSFVIGDLQKFWAQDFREAGRT